LLRFLGDNLIGAILSSLRRFSMGTSFRVLVSAVAGCAVAVGAFVLGYQQGKRVIEIRFVDASPEEVVEKFSGNKPPQYTVNQNA
jgi:hypothetical protein